MIKLYKKILNKYLPIYIAGFWLLGLVSGAMQIFQIILVSEIVNKTIEKQEVVVKLFIPTCICFFSYILVKSINDRLINASVNNVSMELRNQVGRKTNRIKLAGLEEYGQGKIISIITNDIDDIGNWQKSLFLIGNTMTKFVGGIIFSVLMSWEITAILIPFAIVSVLAPTLYLKDLALPDLTSNMAVMPQDTYIFAGSIRENIILNADDRNSDRMEKYCEWLSLQDVITKRKGSYDVDMSSVQSNMSKGQVQRMGLARVMYQNKEIMLLDEPTSALDHELSKKITDELLNMGNNITLIIIAHKLHEPSMFDKIMVMDHGRLVGFAHHDLLIRECSIYQELIHSGLVEKKG